LTPVTCEGYENENTEKKQLFACNASGNQPGFIDYYAAFGDNYYIELDQVLRCLMTKRTARPQVMNVKVV